MSFARTRALHSPTRTVVLELPLVQLHSQICRYTEMREKKSLHNKLSLPTLSSADTNFLVLVGLLGGSVAWDSYKTSLNTIFHCFVFFFKSCCISLVLETEQYQISFLEIVRQAGKISKM